MMHTYVCGSKWNFWSSGASYNQNDVPFGIGYYRRTHGGHRSFMRLYEVGQRRWISVKIREAWSGKIVHFIIENNSRTF
jgi:hypothetical protein